MRVLVIDDDQALLASLRTGLECRGHEVICARNGVEGLCQANQCAPDVVVLDVIMPRLDGWETCRRIRERSDVPILFLSAGDAEADVVRGLDCGADGYMIKPFGLPELDARLEALVRRGRANAPGLPPILRYDDGTLCIDLRANAVYKRGERVSLAPREAKLLGCLVRNAGRVVPHEALLADVWGPGYEREISYLSLYVCYLRQKLEDDPRNPRYIHTRHGIGYCFSGPNSDR